MSIIPHTVATRRTAIAAAIASTVAAWLGATRTTGQHAERAAMDAALASNPDSPRTIRSQPLTDNLTASLIDRGNGPVLQLDDGHSQPYEIALPTAAAAYDLVYVLMGASGFYTSGDYATEYDFAGDQDDDDLEGSDR